MEQKTEGSVARRKSFTKAFQIWKPLLMLPPHGRSSIFVLCWSWEVAVPWYAHQLLINWRRRRAFAFALFEFSIYFSVMFTPPSMITSCSHVRLTLSRLSTTHSRKHCSTRSSYNPLRWFTSNSTALVARFSAGIGFSYRHSRRWISCLAVRLQWGWSPKFAWPHTVRLWWCIHSHPDQKGGKRRCTLWSNKLRGNVNLDRLKIDDLMIDWLIEIETRRPVLFW